MLLIGGCGEQPDTRYSRLAMYQSLDHDEVVVIEIKRDEPPNIPKTIRNSLGDESSQWTQEIITTTIQTGGGDISSKHIEGKWTQGDTLSL